MPPVSSQPDPRRCTMFARIAFLAALAVPLGAGFARAEDKATPDAYVGLTGVCTRVGSGNDTWGYCTSAVVFDKGFPLVCFGLNKRPKEKGQYLYILLFKNGPAKPTSQGISAGVQGNGARTDEEERVTLGDKEVKIALQYGIDDKTNVLKDEVIRVGGTEIKGDARVFLVDLSQKEVTYKPVKVALPTEVPDVGDEGHKTWPATVLRAVEQLRQKSPEVRRFLGQ